MTGLFGGELSPVGLSTQFVEAPEADVTAHLRRIWGRARSTPTGLPFPAALSKMLPLQAPWTRVMIAPAGRWTAVTNNGPQGGDSSAPGPALADALRVRCVVATHAPRFGPGHAQTQLEVLGPGGEAPWGHLRAVSATATDGRWEWFDVGTPFPFEAVERYSARLVRDRFDRQLLLDYLGHLGIPVDDHAFGPATLHQFRKRGRIREVTLEQERQLFGL